RDTAHLTMTLGNSMALWHQRMGHLGINSIRQMETKGLVTGLDLGNADDMELCKGCIHGKQHHLPLPTNGATRATEILGLIHSDVCGPMKNESIGGAKYFVTFVDDKTRMTFVHMLKSKSKVFQKFQDF